MKLKDKNHSYWLGWYFAYALLGLMFVFAVWNGQFDKLCTASGPAWLPWAQPEEHCFREWLSALSGWVGFGAAAVGAYFVYHQLDEQRRQTAFLLGDGKPTVEIIKTRKTSTSKRLARSGVFRVVNWNRRSISICGMRIAVPEGTAEQGLLIAVRMAEPMVIPSHRYALESDGKLKSRPIIRGWLNRQAIPPHRDFFFIYFGSPQPKIAHQAKAWEVVLEIDYMFSDGRGKIETIEVTAPYREFLTSNAITP